MQAVTSNQVVAGTSPLSQAIRSGNHIYVSGQIPRRPDGTMVTGDFAAEVRCVLENVRAILEAGGSGLHRVVRVGAYLTDASLFPEFNRVYREFFTQQPLPARTTIVCALAAQGAHVEVDAVAEVS